MSTNKSITILIIIGIIVLGGIIGIIITHPLERMEETDVNYFTVITIRRLMEMQREAEKFSCGDKLEYNNQEYSTVKIGNQCWLAKNLNYKTEDSLCYDDDSENCETYGRLYSGQEARQVCPQEWILPSDDNFKELEKELGMCEEEGNCVDDIRYRGDNEGSKIASHEQLWEEGELTDNDEFSASGFNALPGGYYYEPEFEGKGELAFFWTSIDYEEDNIRTRSLSHEDSRIFRYYYSEENKFSVRCIMEKPIK